MNINYLEKVVKYFSKINKLNKKLENLLIILTVPHKYCINEEEKKQIKEILEGNKTELNFNINDVRTCDRNAQIFGTIFYNKLLEKLNFNNVKLILSGQNRDEIDDNRYSSNDNKKNIKSTLLWNNLRQNIKLHIKNGKLLKSIIIFDIHSFPREIYNNKKESNDLYIIDYKPFQKITEKIIIYLREKMPKLKFDIKEGQIGINSILDILTLHPLYIPTILLEVCEDLNTTILEDLEKHIINYYLFAFFNCDNIY